MRSSARWSSRWARSSDPKIQETLAATGWNRAEAARRLGMAVRTLSYRLKVLGVKKPE
jgi:transcriptional regulator with GAF, ATPase, and Fis domain